MRPGEGVSPSTLDVVTGKSPADAASTYAKSVETVVGGADKVATG